MLAEAGVGLKPVHYREIFESRPAAGFFEVHAENYMGAGGPPHRYLERLAADYAVSFHGVGLSLAGAEAPNVRHLARWRALIDRYDPMLVSEHVAWSSFAGESFHDLLPVPYTIEALDVLCRNINQMQDALGRRILIENPSRYIEFASSEIPEPEFLSEAARRTGCGLLVDVNNVYVSARNLGEDPLKWLASIPAQRVGEIHLAGYATEVIDDTELFIDDHGSPVCADVWELYQRAVSCFGPVATLIEWDTDVPPLQTLLQEAAVANAILEGASDRPAGTAVS